MAAKCPSTIAVRPFTTRSEKSTVWSWSSATCRPGARASELTESARRYRLLFDSNPQPMWVYDQETLSFLAVNNAAIQSYGYSREEFLGTTLLHIRPEEDVPKLLEVTAGPTTSLHTEGPWRHRKKNGTVITVEIPEHPLVFDGR